MNNNSANGTVDDAAGRVMRQVGEWTGDAQTQIEGGIQQGNRRNEGNDEKARDNVTNAAKAVIEQAPSATEMENSEREHRRLEEERKHHEAIGS